MKLRLQRNLIDHENKNYLNIRTSYQALMQLSAFQTFPFDRNRENGYCSPDHSRFLERLELRMRFDLLFQQSVAVCSDDLHLYDLRIALHTSLNNHFTTVKQNYNSL